LLCYDVCFMHLMFSLMNDMLGFMKNVFTCVIHRQTGSQNDFMWFTACQRTTM